MMNLQSLFPPVTLSETEEFVLAECLSNPAVKKYLKKLAYELTIELAINGEPSTGETLEAFARKQATVRGQLNTLYTLSTIEAPVKPQA